MSLKIQTALSTLISALVVALGAPAGQVEMEHTSSPPSESPASGAKIESTSQHRVEGESEMESPEQARLLGLESLRIAVKKDGGVPLPSTLNEYVKDRQAAIQLGKALFWDTQVGSDGKTACASCHFHAGADSRTTNVVNPGFSNVTNTRDGAVKGYMSSQKYHDPVFQTRDPNTTLVREDFPLVKWINELVVSTDGSGKVLPAAGNSNDIVSSMGTFRTQFDAIVPGSAVDSGTPMPHPVWTLSNGSSLRQVGHRNAPSVINAIFNNSNFWDGHANPFFNGQNQFGVQHDPIIMVNDPVTGIDIAKILLDHGSLAGQTSQPVTEPHEMAFGIAGTQNGRNLPEIGRKMLRASPSSGAALVPLGLQKVSRNDSVLGPLSRAPHAGLSVSYEALIKKAFHEKYWNSPLIGVISETENLTHIEANFALFFGLSIALYESTLVSDNTPFDQWMETGRLNEGFGERALAGLNVFANQGRCIACHAGPELTTASVRHARGNTNLIQASSMRGDGALYDTGFYNIAVTPTTDDIGRGGLDFRDAPFSYSRQALLKRLEISDVGFPILGNNHIPAVEERSGLPVCIDVNANGVCDPNEAILPQFQRAAVDGAFKSPGLRNVELTGPYFHNGGMATLRQVVQFFNRGGNFCDFNREDMNPAIVPLHLSNSQEEELVAFLLSLTDERVRYRKAPFDHPELRLTADGMDTTGTRVIEAVGRHGARKPLRPFLNLDPEDAIFTPSGLCSGPRSSSHAIR